MTTELLEQPATVAAPSDTLSELSSSDKQQEAIYAAFHPSRLTWKNMDWVTLVWMVLMHLGCLAAPFYFSWQAFGVAALLHWLTASIGICLCYHRYLSHRSFKLKSPVEFFVLLCGAVSGEGSPLTWTATHRLHHQRSDLKGDPHSPTNGKWWSHLLWLFVSRTPAEQEALFQKYVPDLAEKPMLRFFERTYGFWLVATGAVLYAIGGMPMLIWGLCVRIVFAYHCTWLINSATHLWGYRNYETADMSRNLWWVAILAYGEGWHNNHHAHPSIAPAGHHWWEVDMTWWSIKALRFLGLATDVKDEIPKPQKTPNRQTTKQQITKQAAA